MKIVLLVVGLPFIVLGLFLFGQGVGLFSGLRNAVLIDAGAGVVALGYRPSLVRIAITSPQVGAIWAAAQSSVSPLPRPAWPSMHHIPECRAVAVYLSAGHLSRAV